MELRVPEDISPAFFQRAYGIVASQWVKDGRAAQFEAGITDEFVDEAVEVARELQVAAAIAAANQS
jgi:hypothetical protein